MSVDWALLLPRLRASDLLSPPPAPSLPDWPGPLPERFTRVYFGVEQCQHLQPSAAEWQTAALWARTHDCSFTAVTPPVTDSGLERLLSGLGALLAADPAAEIVFNDWGVYRTVHRRWPAVPLRIGRLLHRQMRDPRSTSADSAVTPSIWRETASSARRFAGLLDDLGVSGVESDFPLQGLADGALGNGQPKATLHLPWVCFAVGRLCPVQALGRPDVDALSPPASCAAPCRGYITHLQVRWTVSGADPSPSGAIGDAPTELVEKGNSHFYRLGPAQLADAHRFSSRNPIDRIALSSTIPM